MKTKLDHIPVVGVSPEDIADSMDKIVGIREACGYSLKEIIPIMSTTKNKEVYTSLITMHWEK